MKSAASNSLLLQGASKENKVEMLVFHLAKMGPRSVRRFYDLLNVIGCDMVVEHLRFNGKGKCMWCHL